jgi:hypothetical protein
MTSSETTRRTRQNPSDFLDSGLAGGHARWHPRIRRNPVTVCIGAICRGPLGHPLIIGATDQKISTPDIQFEFPKGKIWRFSSSCVALLAGDFDVQTEICQRTERDKPKSVKHAIRLYLRHLGQFNRRQAESKVLAHFGLTMKMFLEKQDVMLPSFVAELKDQIEQVKTQQEIETIICGMDAGFPNLYVIDRTARFHCHTALGFAAIGDGEWHALSQFMFAEYDPDWHVGKALLLLHSAKRHAEVAPGVGKATKMFFIAPEVDYLKDTLCERIKNIYDDMDAVHKEALKNANAVSEAYLNEILQAPPQEQPSGPVPVSPKPRSRRSSRKPE